MNKIIEQHYCNDYAEVFSQYLTNTNTEHAQLAEMYIKLAKRAGNPSRFSKIIKALLLKLNTGSKGQVSKLSYKQLLGAFLHLLIDQVGEDLAKYIHDSIDNLFSKDVEPAKKDSTPAKQIIE